MSLALLPALLLAAAEPSATSIPIPIPIPSPSPSPSPTSTPTATSTATPTSPPSPRVLDLSTGPSLGGAAAAVALLAGLAAVALLAARRRMRPGARLVEVVETTHLGPRRALVVARVQGELLLLASSEAGIAVLQARPDPGQAPLLEPVATPGSAAAPASPVFGLLGRLRLHRARPAAGIPPAFDALLHESAEDLELRRKLAQGLAGSVR